MGLRKNPLEKRWTHLNFGEIAGGMRPLRFSLPVVLCLCAASAFAQWKPVPNSMLTEWGRNLDPKKVWAEYPRPGLVREDWTCLNGLWDFAVTPRGAGQPESWTQKILVPFAPESALSGVGRLIEPNEEIWYRHSLPDPKPGMRTLLNFEAVDYEATVWVNGKEVGSHKGSSTPFSFDITEALKPTGNEVVVRAYDATEGFQLKGKQHRNPHGIWYTRVSGIWQSVWLEQVPERWIEGLTYGCDIKTGTVTVDPKLAGTPVEGETVKLTAYFGGKEVASASGTGKVELKIPDAKLWEPGSPNLYDIVAELVNANGQVVDKVKSYTALREVGRAKDALGNWRFTINGRPIFHWGPLDQGWWPDGLLTPPSEEAMLSDIKFLQDAGFNMIRKHIKIEPRRYYYDCDRLGMLVWQDQLNGGGASPRWTHLAPNPEDANWPDEHHEQYVLEYKRMVDHLRNHPSIVVWTPFNEAWGQHRTMETGQMAVEYDPTRLINIASGGNFWPVGHIADQHAYPHPAFPLKDERFADYVKVVGEFGGHGFPVKGHLWNPNADNWGYGGLPKSIDEWKQRYERSIDILARLRQRGVSGGVYTQTTDVEGEINGLLTYDRIPKIDTAWLRSMAKKLYAANGLIETKELVPTSENEPQQWRWTEDTPQSGWEKPGFNDSSWREGQGGFGVQGNGNMHVRTEWRSPDIWLRRKFTLSKRPTGKPMLRIFHDNAATVYLNGVKIAELDGHVNEYIEVELANPSALKTGENVLAIHCHQDDGGQYIDAGFVEELVR